MKSKKSGDLLINIIMVFVVVIKHAEDKTRFFQR